MSPRKPVLPLSYVCVKTVSQQLIYALSDDEEGLNYAKVENYLLGANYEVLQELLKNILNSVNLDAATRFSCLQVLLRPDVKKLDSGMFPHPYYEKILEIIAWKGKGLKQLNLKGVWARDYPGLLKDLINSLKNLQLLIMPHMADDSVLESIVSCKNLTVLDISGEATYTQHGLKKFQSRTLNVLDIGNFGKPQVCETDSNSFELLAELLVQLPNLKSLRTYSFTGSVLLAVYSKNPTYKTKLTYLHDTGTSLVSMEAIVNLCPKLESIHLDSAEICVIKELVNLKKLNCLKLTKPDDKDLLYYLSECGANIEILKLSHNKNTILDLSKLCVITPNISTLECYLMHLTFSACDNYFMLLQNVEILYCDISDESLKLLLSNTPFLRRILVGCVINLTDGDIFRLCAESDFNSLEEIWFSKARGLTSTSVELLMGHCPQLRVIGQISEWDILEEDLETLRTVIRISNLDLCLLPQSIS